MTVELELISDYDSCPSHHSAGDSVRWSAYTASQLPRVRSVSNVGLIQQSRGLAAVELSRPTKIRFFCATIPHGLVDRGLSVARLMYMSIAASRRC